MLVPVFLSAVSDTLQQSNFHSCCVATDLMAHKANVRALTKDSFSLVC